MSTSDSLFYTLPKRVQHLIDDAFSTTIVSNNALTSQRSSGNTTDAVNIPEVGGGGGSILEPTELLGGGFLVEDPQLEADSDISPQQISLELIPSVLQRLDLPPDDEEILSVFKNAASGWTSASLDAFGAVNAQDKYVSREDWRSVCAVLLENHANEIDQDQDDSSHSLQIEDEDDEAAMSDDYVEARSTGSSMNESSDDEYREGGSSSRVRPGKQPQRRRHLSPTLLSAKSAVPTSRQQQTCLNTFALFFPDVAPSELPKQRIMIANIQRVAKLLGEKIKADEIIEMLDMFSTSPDKTMDFNDFMRMMIEAKLA